MTIKEARKQAKLTQGGLSAKLGIPLSTIKDWERGARKPPDYVTRLIVAAICPNVGEVKENELD